MQKVSSASRLGVSLLTLEDPGRLKLPAEIEIEWATPCAARLLEAWAAKGEREREVLLGIPPEPFYLRPPHITPSEVGGRPRLGEICRSRTVLGR